MRVFVDDVRQRSEQRPLTVDVLDLAELRRLPREVVGDGFNESSELLPQEPGGAASGRRG